MWCMPKRNLSKRTKFEASFLQRILSFLLQDLVPTLIMLIILSIFTSLVAEKIYRAKTSRSRTISMFEKVSHQKSPSLREELQPKGGRLD
jgi:uncharacterized membrane-anchored protein YitT (DUF2179 family)